jgi:hypothetical protein
MGTPHVHAELIKAWADGAEIQARSHPSAKWADVENPKWVSDMEYRVKPEQSDLEKYGVEAGDIWKILPLDIVMTVRYVRKEHFIGLDGLDYNLTSLALLIFRRGVVDKL